MARKGPGKPEGLHPIDDVSQSVAFAARLFKFGECARNRFRAWYVGKRAFGRLEAGFRHFKLIGPPSPLSLFENTHEVRQLLLQAREKFFRLMEFPKSVFGDLKLFLFTHGAGA